MTKILAINGSYRDDGLTDQVVDLLTRELTAAGSTVEVILLRDYPINFCTNCRECMQAKGKTPGTCVQRDGMHELITKLESADAYILASPTNAGSVTALFKRFMERLAVYMYWPWDKNAPLARKAGAGKAGGKKAVLVSSCAAPGFLGKLAFSTHGQLKSTANTLGATTVGDISVGLIGKHRTPQVPGWVPAKVKKLSAKLM